MQGFVLAKGFWRLFAQAERFPTQPCMFYTYRMEELSQYNIRTLNSRRTSTITTNFCMWHMCTRMHEFIKVRVAAHGVAIQSYDESR